MSSQIENSMAYFNNGSPIKSDELERPKRFMKYRNTNITKMLEPEILSPQKPNFREIKSYPVKEFPENANSSFPTMKISKFTNKKMPESAEKDTDEKEAQSYQRRGEDFPIMGSLDMEPKPLRKISEQIDTKELFADFKRSFCSLDTAEKQRVLAILKQIMIDSPNHRVFELTNSTINGRFSLVN